MCLYVLYKVQKPMLQSLIRCYWLLYASFDYKMSLRHRLQFLELTHGDYPCHLQNLLLTSLQSACFEVFVTMEKLPSYVPSDNKDCCLHLTAESISFEPNENHGKNVAKLTIYIAYLSNYSFFYQIYKTIW